MISGFQSSTISAYAGYSPQTSNAQGQGPTVPNHEKEKTGVEAEKKEDPNELTEAEKEQVRKLELRDAEVRTHEMAHLAAAGSLARGGASYEYQLGPDGKNYAIGGHVNIDTSPGKTPEETKQKAAKIRAAALAPSDPSGQDLKVAAQASSMLANANASDSSSETENEQKIDKNSHSDTSEKSDSGKETEADSSFSPEAKFQDILSAYSQSGNAPREAIYNFQA